MIEYKSAGFAGLANEGGGDGWTISGLASTHDVDLQNDVIPFGAYTQSLHERPTVPLLWGHEDKQLPIGRTIAMRETSAGLFFKARLSDTRQGRDVRTLLGDSVLSGISIGYTAPKTSDVTIGGQRVRSLDQIDLYELSVVTWPAQPGARATLDAAKTARARRAMAIARYEYHKSRGYVPPWVDRQYTQAMKNEWLAEIARARQLAEVEAALAELRAM